MHRKSGYGTGEGSVQAHKPKRLLHILERYLPEQRLFLRSDTETRFIRLKSTTQAGFFLGVALLVGWTILATSVLIIDSIGSGSAREQALREQKLYEARLSELSGERDARAEEVRLAQKRFYTAFEEVSQMQSRLLASEDRRKELETGIEVIQTTLRRTMNERDAAIAKSETLLAELEAKTGITKTGAGRQRDIEGTLDFLAAALADTAAERDQMAAMARNADLKIEEMTLEAKLSQEKHNRIFAQLEDAVSVSLTPLDKMFRAAGMPTDRILETVRRGYSGQGGPLTPLAVSTKGEARDEAALRTNYILEKLDKLNLYRLAAEKAPFASPLKSAFRFTSGFGWRRDPKGTGTRMHNGTDFAARHGTPIYATADGTVIHAGWQSGFGKLVKLRHEFGIETLYAHNSKLFVEVGQKVSRGDKIAAMGNTGRSTGTHLHYEVRVDGKPVNPMIYIKAAQNVF